MPSINKTNAGREYWTSLDELSDAPEFRQFVENEFPSFAPELLQSPTRRKFLKLMGASMAMAGLAGCRWPVEEIAPYAARPTNRLPGVPVDYATSMEFAGRVYGLLVKSYDGRPIKIEGNPRHPETKGTADSFAQASVLDLYDPDRLMLVKKGKAAKAGGKKKTWADFQSFVNTKVAGLASGSGGKLAVLTEQSTSPTQAALLQKLRDKLGRNVAVYEYEPITRENESQGMAMAIDGNFRPHYRFDKVQVVASFDEDFLMAHPRALKQAREFMAGRDVDKHGRRVDGADGSMTRLYMAESTYSITGSLADHRLALPSHAIAALMMQLVGKLAEKGLALPAEHQGIADAAAHADTAPGLVDQKKVDLVLGSMADDLMAHPGQSVVCAGPRQPKELHALAHVLNRALHNIGKGVIYTEPGPGDGADHTQNLKALTEQMKAGSIDTLVILGGNPAFDAPVDVGFAGALSKVAHTVHLTHGENETSQLCEWKLPRAHYLEAWADVRSPDGTISITQPLIEPLYGGRTPAEVLAMLCRDDITNAYELVRRTLRDRKHYDDFEKFWRHCLHEGVVPETAAADRSNALSWRADDNLAAKLTELAARASAVTAEQPEIVFIHDNHVFDGRFANNGWLQETPDPITKLTWDNAAIVGPALAERLDVRRRDLIRIEAGGRSVELPVCVIPGQADGSITIPMGYGRQQAGRVGNDTGFDVYPLRTSDALHMRSGVTITKLGKTYMLAGTQDHHAISSPIGDRAIQTRLPMIVREASLDDYMEEPDFVKHAVHHPPRLSLFEEHNYEDNRKWGMSIDLNKCIGCSACVVACTAENNIPVVGKSEVERGREMHWIRIDRYFKGEPEDPQMVHQPLTCHQCENAPCEQVCPVAATMHSDEGLNDMVYNRCIGTRYCANNCPYKVRRFNWFYNHFDETETQKMVYNPEVTVRSRGVMEKCTYCVQRIANARIDAKNDQREIEDGEIVPACAQTCPTQAIVFGDLNRSDSEVTRMQAHERSYALLAELNVKPRTQYLGRLRNPAVQEPGWTQHEHPGGHGQVHEHSGGEHEGQDEAAADTGEAHG